MSLVADYRNRMARDIVRRGDQVGADVWPAPRVDMRWADTYIAPPLLSRLHDCYSTVRDPRVIAKAFHGPSRVVQLMNMFMQPAADEADSHARNWLAEQMLNTISLLRNGDPFLIHGVNFVDPPQAAPFGTLAPSQRRWISELLACLSLYVEFLCFAFVGISRENHGPYFVGDDTLLVRDFYDLRAPFWDFSSTLPFHSVRITTRHAGHLNVTVDFPSRLATTASLHGTLHSAAVIVDGQAIDLTDGSLESLVMVVVEHLKSAAEESDALGSPELIQQWARVLFWATSPVMQRAGKNDWSPPPELIERLGEPAGDSWLADAMQAISKLPDSEREARYRRLLDPGGLVKS